MGSNLNTPISWETKVFYIRGTISAVRRFGGWLGVTSRMIIYPEGVMLCSKPGAFSRRSLVRPSKVHHHADSSS
ncbi:protein of unknown function [Methylocaldum szegediense]|uniref:Uncharacterized protein n=1 Tax=Methylocaldum szegediense TaxID=73780 RepID=A0ABM9I838_9GAMM|nr:protein of unknown function [Methylocaldum szegediense]